MKTFKELEQTFGQVHVSLAEPDLSGAGILILDGDSTKLTITTYEKLNRSSHPNGWFDLRLRGSDGKLIHVHNALPLREQLPSPGETTHHYEIYPNIVVFGAESLTQDGRVESVSFTAHRLREFFRYEVVEWQTLKDAPTETLEALRRLREIERRYPREYEFFDPQTIYLIHRLPEVIAFKIKNRSYNIHMSGTGTAGWFDVDIRARPRATIEFDDAVSISTAIDHIWEWRRFFNQAAMDPIAFQAISFNRKGSEPISDAPVYLPALNETEASRRASFPFGPAIPPFNSWTERAQLGALMKGWLEKQPDRVEFRAKLDRVVGSMYERVEARHIMDLASGLESLSELDRTSPYSNEQVEVLVVAACTAAEEAGILVDAQRVRGVLGLLRKENLSRRLISVLDTTKPWLPPYDAKGFGKAIQGYRNRAAHGAGAATFTPRQMSQTIQAFAGLSALWDLTTSGLDPDAANKQINALSIAAHALIEAFPHS